jgi:hypothetical protein
MSDERLELVFDEATRAIELQSRAVDESRTRAGALLTAGAIVASFLGAQALEDQNPGNWGKAGTAAFVLLVVVVVYVMFPRGFNFVLGARHIIDNHIDTDDHPNDEDQLRWALALQLEDAYDENERTRGRLALALAVGCVALGIEVLAWLIEIGA